MQLYAIFKRMYSSSIDELYIYSAGPGDKHLQLSW